MSTILITGGAGFIGSHLCDRFLADEHDVICVDNLASGTRDNLAHLLVNPHFKFIEHDVTLPLEPFTFHLDAILHFASLASQSGQRDFLYATSRRNHDGQRPRLQADARPRSHPSLPNSLCQYRGSLRQSQSPSSTGDLRGTRLLDRS